MITSLTVVDYKLGLGGERAACKMLAFLSTRQELRSALTISWPYGSFRKKESTSSFSAFGNDA